MVLANVPTFLMNPDNSFNGMQGFFAWIWAVAIGVPTIIAVLFAVADGSQQGHFEAYYRKAFPLVLPFIWVQILTGLIGFLGFILLIIPGIIWAIQYSFSSFVMVLEGKRGMAALRQSKEYVKGNWWKIFFRVVGLMIVIIIGAVLLAVGIGPLTEVLITFLYPLFIILAFLLFKDLKSAKTVQVPPQEQVAQPVS